MRLDPYSEVDGVIDTWINATGSTLFTGWAEDPLRYFHLPGDPPHECFQIVIFLPSADRVVVQAAAIDTNDNTEEALRKKRCSE